MPEAASPTRTDIRELSSREEYDACLRLQRLTWGDSFEECVPPAILKVSQQVGGVAAGAFAEDGDMIGFVFGLSGVRSGRLAHWSHMLAVLPEWRDRGIGRSLKEYQRDRIVREGIEVMFWTFDPLVARNAHLNLDVLGVEVDEYVRDMYGPPDRNSLDAVIGTDRFVVRWELVRRSREFRVPVDDEAPVSALVADESGPRLNLPESTPDVALIEVPPDIHELKSENPALAARWREVTRTAFESLLAQEMKVASLQRSGGRCYYRLERSIPID